MTHFSNVVLNEGEVKFGYIETKAFGTQGKVIDGNVREDAHSHASLKL